MTPIPFSGLRWNTKGARLLQCSAWDADAVRWSSHGAARHVSHWTSLDRVVAHAPKRSKCCECHRWNPNSNNFRSQDAGFCPDTSHGEGSMADIMADIFETLCLWCLYGLFNLINTVLMSRVPIVSEWQCIQDNYTRLTRRLLDGGCMIKLCLGGQPQNKTVDGWRHRLWRCLRSA